MRSISVALHDNNYRIVVCNNQMGELGSLIKSLSLGDQAIIITNPLIKKIHGKNLSKQLKRSGLGIHWIEVADGEKSKSANEAFRIIKKLSALGLKKRIFLIAFGGGVIGDLVGFVAAVYKRGIPLVQVPTTFLAQIDSAIGGKVAIDLPFGKNLVGAFYQPRLVFSDISFLLTLSKRQIRNGLSEAVKYGIICDKNFFDFIEHNIDGLLQAQAPLMLEAAYHCSRIKARIVETDEKETKNIRTILNFGHTVGHAIEAASRFRLQHGESVSIGMCGACEISRRMGLLKRQDQKRIEKVLTKIGLPTKTKFSLKQILTHMPYDKKFIGKRNKFVLATSIGSVKVVEAVPQKIIQAAIKSCLV